MHDKINTFTKMTLASKAIKQWKEQIVRTVLNINYTNALPHPLLFKGILLAAMPYMERGSTHTRLLQYIHTLGIILATYS